MRPLGWTEAYSVLSPEAISRVEPARWSQQARTFLDAVVAVEGDPISDTFELTVAPPAGEATRVMVASFPIAETPEIVAAAERGVAAIGGAGMDALVARAQRVWQIANRVDGDPRAPLVAAALLAMVLLGPIVPPDEATIYGVRGARVRLEKLGWPRLLT
jgi:hypothetical protein